MNTSKRTIVKCGYAKAESISETIAQAAFKHLWEFRADGLYAHTCTISADGRVSAWSPTYVPLEELPR